MAANNSRVRASTTAMTLHERFTILRRAGPARTKRGAAQARESAAEIARGSSKNKRLALQMEKRFASGGTPAKKAVQQRLGQTAAKRGRGTVTGSGARARGQLRSASRARGVRSRVQTTPKPQKAVSPKRGRGLRARSTNRRIGSSAVRPAAANQSPAVMQNVRGRGLQRGGRGRGRGRGGVARGSQSKKPVSKEELDQQLDQYMSGTKTVLNTHTPDVTIQ